MRKNTFVVLPTVHCKSLIYAMLPMTFHYMVRKHAFIITNLFQTLFVPPKIKMEKAVQPCETSLIMQYYIV